MAKYTPEQYNFARSLFVEKGASYTQCAEHTGVSITMLKRRGKRDGWMDLRRKHEDLQTRAERIKRAKEDLASIERQQDAKYRYQQIAEKVSLQLLTDMKTLLERQPADGKDTATSLAVPGSSMVDDFSFFLQSSHRQYHSKPRRSVSPGSGRCATSFLQAKPRSSRAHASYAKVILAK